MFVGQKNKVSFFKNVLKQSHKRNLLIADNSDNENEVSDVLKPPITYLLKTSKVWLAIQKMPKTTILKMTHH